MKLINTFLRTAAVLLSAAAFTVTAAADTIAEFDPAHPCSVTITLTTDQHQQFAGAEVSIYRVADAAVNEAGSFAYTLTADFKDGDFDLTDIESPRLADAVYSYANTHAPKGVSMLTDADGIAVFNQLKCGLYLAAETGNNETATFTPFLIALPGVSENGTLFYDSYAEPKIDSPLRTSRLRIKKIWNDDGKNRPENVQVQVLRGTKVFDTVVLSESNNWSATWEALVYADDWSVREVAVPKGYTVTYDKDGMTFTVTNTVTLIQTGQILQPVLLLAGGGLLLILFGLVLMIGGKKKKNGSDS